MIPSAAPYIFTGLRIGIGLSWLAIVAAEMLTGGVGIGFFIWDAWNSSRLPDIVVALVYIGLIGFVLDRLVAAVGTHRHARHRHELRNEGRNQADEQLSEDRSRRQDVHPRLSANRGAQGRSPCRSPRASTSP